jgi:hypothetical protein
MQLYAGSGSVAQQFANGGIMNGDLNVTGQYLSAGVNLLDIFTGGGGGAGDAAVNSLVHSNSGKWESTYTIVNSNSATWGAGGSPQTLSFNESNAQLSIQFGNTISLSSLSGYTETDPIYTSWAQSNTARLTQSSLDTTYVNVTGDIMTGDLSAPNLSAQSVVYVGQYEQFNISLAANPTWTEGILFYNSADHCLSYYNDVNNLHVDIGQQQVVRVYNDTGSTITKGNVVYLSGAHGNRPNAYLATSSYSQSTADNTIGIATADILSTGNKTGYVITFGTVRDVTVNPGTYNVGDKLYLDVSPGIFTNIQPAKPNHVVELGTVIRSTGDLIDIFVRIRTAQKLNELHNVYIQSPAANDVLIYDPLSAGYWKNYSSNSWIDSSTWVSSNSSQLGQAELDTRYVNVTGDTITGTLSVTNSVYISSVQFTGNTSTAQTGITALNTFLQINVNGAVKYIRLYDIE